MDQLLEGRRLRRRAFLLGSGAAVGGLAGCLDDDPDDDQSAGGGGGGGDDDDVGDGEESVADLTAPEPDFLVGDGAEADYETLQEAYDALESGDVIGLEPGRYTVKPEVDNAEIGDGEDLRKTYTYVGDPGEETVVEFVEPEARSFIVRGPQRFLPEDGPPGFWHLSLEIPDGVSYARVDEFEDDEETLQEHLEEVFGEEYDDELLESYADEQTAVNFCTVNGSLDGPVDATETTFEGELAHEISPTDCRFRSHVGGPRLAGRRCQFDSTLDSDGGFLLDSTVDGTANLNNVTMIRCELAAGLNVTGNGRVTDCVVQSKPDDHRAIEILSAYDVAITESEIYGSVRSTQDGAYVQRFELNTFELDGGTPYIVDGAPAVEIYLNAFYGGDVRITTDTGDLTTFPVDDLTLFDPERGLGNYYAEWDGVDEVDEGVLETRTLPGADGEMDRFPLANDDIHAYAEQAAKEAEEEEDD